MDAKLVMLRSEFGMWGVGVYWTLLEFISEQMKGIDPQPVATLSMRELCSFLGCKRNKLETFLKRLQNVRGMNYTLKKDILVIECPKLLEIKDNYHKDLVETSKGQPRNLLPEVDVEVNVEVKGKEDKKARPESVEDVISFFATKNASEKDAQDFWDHFTSNGWRVGGRAPMKEWHAAASKWIRNIPEFKRGNGQKVEDTEVSKRRAQRWGIDQ